MFYNPTRPFGPCVQDRLVRKAIAVLLDDRIDGFRKKSALLLLKTFVPFWRDLIDDVTPIDRSDFRVALWKKKVRERDGNRCCMCGNEEELEVHHILSWSEYPPGRIDVNNGITLCNFCHVDMHVQERQLILHRSGKVKSP